MARQVDFELSTVASSEFSEEKLLEAAKQYADSEHPPDDEDLRIVLQHVKFLRRLPGKRYQLTAPSETTRSTNSSRPAYTVDHAVRYRTRESV